jgi:N-methylhydantoinase A
MRVVGIDVGGTFTDLVEVDDATGEYRYHKLASTPDDPSRAFLAGAEELAAGRDAPGRTIHGSTVATNTLIQRSGAKVGLITTRGHRDVLEIARGVRPYAHIFDLLWVKPEPLVPRHLRVDVTGRLDAAGRVVEPLAEAEVELACEFLAEHGVEAVAICFLFSYLNDVHERRAAAIVGERLPHVPVSVSADILPQWREFERTSTTVADAHVKPVMSGYLDRLRAGLAAQGHDAELLIMKSNGGVTSATTAAAYPIETYLSGPAAGVVAGQAIGRATGHANVVVTDMGGTSFDISLVTEGRVARRTEGEAAEGVPVNVSMLDVRAIGAGGGSIAWIDAGGGLRVGPRSAGADPGPACYGRGGDEPTVTDANLVLGRLAADAFLGGRFRLDPARAEAAIRERVAEPLGLGLLEAAQGVVDVCVANAVREIRSVTAERGIDHRAYALVAGGGAGPLHAAQIARELGMATVIVPTFPGVLSAIGLVLSDLRFDTVRSLPCTLERDGVERIAGFLEQMAAAGVARLRAERFAGEPLVALALDMRYRGQNWEIEVPVTLDRLDVANVAEAFDREHERLYRFQMPEHEHEVINLRVSVAGPLERGGEHLPRRRPAAAASGARSRAVHDDTLRATVDTRVLERDALAPGDEIAGPAIVEELDTTVVLPTGWRASVDELGTMILTAQAPGARS